MKQIVIILSLFLIISCKKTTIPEESSYTFKLPQKEVFVKTSKYQGGRFTIFFAQDSLSLNNSKDSIEYRSGDYIRIIVDTTNIYIDANKYRIGGIISNMGKNHFNMELISDSSFNSFFENEIQKQPYTFISIDTKEYSISVNQHRIRKGNIYGGW